MIIAEARPKAPPAIKMPVAPVPLAPYAAETRANGIHVVDTRTGQSWGIAATSEIAAAQIAAANRISQ